MIQANKIGLGCVTFGREIDEHDAFRLMDYAVANNIALFDTAAAYGSGASEKIVGNWLKQNPTLRKSVCICTKIIPPYTAQQIHQSVNDCLIRLQTGYIDVLYVHRWDEQLANYESWLALHALLQQGIIKNIGVSNFNYSHLVNTLILLADKPESIKIHYLQNNHNLAVSDIGADIKMLCKENDIRIVTFSPLGAGFLTGKHLNGVQKSSRFDIMPAHQNIYFTPQAQSRLSKLMEVSARTGYPPEFLAMAWATHQPEVYAVLGGGRTPAHLQLAIDARHFYDEQIFAELESA